MAQHNVQVDAALSTLVSQDTGLGDGATTIQRANAYGALWVQQVNTTGVGIPSIGVEETILASAARTATINVELTNTLYKGVVIIFDWTVEDVAATLTLHIEGESTLGSDWYTILSSAALTAVGTTVYRVYPSMAATANLTATDFLPPTWRFRVAVGDASSTTYSVNAIHLP